MEGRQKRLPTIFSYNCSAIEFLLVFSLFIFREISVLDLLCFTMYLSLIFFPVYIRDGKRITNQKPHAQIKTTHTFKPRGLIFVLNKLKLDPEVFIYVASVSPEQHAATDVSKNVSDSESTKNSETTSSFS